METINTNIKKDEIFQSALFLIELVETLGVKPSDTTPIMSITPNGVEHYDFFEILLKVLKWKQKSTQ